MAIGVTHIFKTGDSNTALVCSWECAKRYARYARIGISRFDDGYDVDHPTLCANPDCATVMRPVEFFA